ncbi:MAG TPA: hypothetical protein VMV87_13905 [Burkholderiales bacterium]|nr:hypothetical protein [Burkholderiales bacterium]
MRPNGARKQALLIGTGWTLAVLAALALFKSSPTAPIYLWALGIVALGWAGILRHGLAAQGRAASAAAAACGEHGVALDGIAQAVGVQMRQARGELLRVDELLGHAIEQLMAAFNNVSDGVSRHQSELARTAAAAPGTDASERLRQVAEHVAREIDGAVMALQFRDVVGQKLGHVRRELEVLEQLMQRVREASAAQLVLAPTVGRAQLARRVQGLLQELEQMNAASPVQQELMHAGEVELF